MPARITRVACEVAKSLDHLADPAANITIERAYAPDWLSPTYWKDNPNLAEEFVGRRVYVFGATQRQEGPATRSEDFNDYGIVIIVLERYEGNEPEIPNSWIDERVEWVEENIYDHLGDARETENEVIPWAFPLNQDWNQIYSPELLRSLKLFRSEVTIVYRAVEEG